MRKLILLLFILAGAMCTALVLTGTEFAQPAVKKSDIPKPLKEDLKYIREQEKESAPKAFFSQQDFFYAEDIQVHLSSNIPGTVIYYTLDGSDPTPESLPYENPIYLTAGDEVSCTVLKAVAVKDGLKGDTTTHSYFLGKNINNRFTSYVFSLSSDPSNLFEEERGILIPGKIYTDYMDSTEKPEKSIWRRPANYNERGRDWERPLFVEAFKDTGERIVAQRAGVRVKGESSRGLPQKSLRIIARKSYEPKYGKFKYPFFPSLTKKDGYGAPVLTSDTLILNSGGSVYSITQIIDPLIARLAAKAGYEFVAPAYSTSVFLNGKYYGHAWLMPRMDEKYFKKIYGTSEETFDVLKGGEHKIYTKNPFLRHEFWQLHNYANSDMTDDNVFNAFNSAMDVSNLLYYMSIELYTGNCDWPRSNVSIWRYTGEMNRGNTPALPSELDGRWRYIMYDMQRAMDTSIFDTSEESSRAHFSYKSIHFALETIPFLQALLKRPELAAEFANNMCDLAFEHFTEEKVSKIAQDLLDESMHEFAFAATGSIGGPVPDILHKIKNEKNRVDIFSRERPGYIIKELQEIFGYTNLFSINLEGPGKINTVTSGYGQYFVECRVPVTQNMPKWHVFDYWLVNGQKRTEESLLISSADAVNDTVDIKLVTHEQKPEFYLTDPYDKKTICGFSLVNSENEERSTAGLYLSDKLYELKKWPLPEFTIAPGGRIEFVGQSYQSTDAILKVDLNFNPRTGEVVYLSDNEGKILDYIVIP